MCSILKKCPGRNFKVAFTIQVCFESLCGCSVSSDPLRSCDCINKLTGSKPGFESGSNKLNEVVKDYELECEILLVSCCFVRKHKGTYKG